MRYVGIYCILLAAHILFGVSVCKGPNGLGLKWFREGVLGGAIILAVIIGLVRACV